jgi:UDP:flavonoid glycosyltransferase YjiC (YdhE family)
VSRRVYVAAAEYPGHVFPEVALARALAERGNEVILQTDERWREPVEAAGARLLPVEEAGGVLVHGSFDGKLAEAARATEAVLRDLRPDVVVADSAVAAPPLAAELAGVPLATLVPTLYPVQERGSPFYPLGMAYPRTVAGRALWAAANGPTAGLREQTAWLAEVPGRLGEVRASLGLPPLANGTAITSYGAISAGLCLVATFPQLEYPRRWPAGVEVTGPMLAERGHPPVELPAGDEPLVLVATSTAQDPERVLLGAALEALAAEPVRVIATLNAPGEEWPREAPANARVVDWISYGQAMPEAALVVTSGGHGTVVRSLAEGAPALVCPMHGDQPEIGARLAWAGAGLALPRRLLGPGALRIAARRILGDPGFAARARELAAWAREHDGARRGAELVEAYSASAPR